MFVQPVNQSPNDSSMTAASPVKINTVKTVTFRDISNDNADSFTPPITRSANKKKQTYNVPVNAMSAKKQNMVSIGGSHSGADTSNKPKPKNRQIDEIVKPTEDTVKDVNEKSPQLGLGAKEKK